MQNYVCYVKRTNDEGVVDSLITYNNFHPKISDPLMVEITQEEYEALLAEIEASNQPEEPTTDEISAEEALDIILGGEGV